MREYGLDLRECLWGDSKLGCRKLLNLAKNLSSTSITVHTVTKGWRDNEELLALILELLDYGNKIALLANGVKKHELPPPLDIPRPYSIAAQDASKVQKRPATKDELMQLLKGRMTTGTRKEV